jgi:hypothetical protein
MGRTIRCWSWGYCRLVEGRGSAIGDFFDLNAEFVIIFQRRPTLPAATGTRGSPPTPVGALPATGGSNPPPHFHQHRNRRFRPFHRRPPLSPSRPGRITSVFPFEHHKRNAQWGRRCAHWRCDPRPRRRRGRRRLAGRTGPGRAAPGGRRTTSDLPMITHRNRHEIDVLLRADSSRDLPLHAPVARC